MLKVSHRIGLEPFGAGEWAIRQQTVLFAVVLLQTIYTFGLIVFICCVFWQFVNIFQLMFAFRFLCWPVVVVGLHTVFQFHNAFRIFSETLAGVLYQQTGRKTIPLALSKVRRKYPSIALWLNEKDNAKQDQRN